MAAMALGTAGGGGGCLLPPPTEELTPVENQPPRIIPDSLSPWPFRGPTQLSTQCASYTFNATLTDPDAADVLYWRIFFDYKDGQYRGDADEGTVNSPRDEAFPMSFVIRPNDARFSDTSNGAHWIELLVSDRPFENDNSPMRGRTVAAGALTDSALWTVLLTAEKLPCEQY